jgi:hypothetical protein
MIAVFEATVPVLESDGCGARDYWLWCQRSMVMALKNSVVVSEAAFSLSLSLSLYLCPMCLQRLFPCLFACCQLLLTALLPLSVLCQYSV